MWFNRNIKILNKMYVFWCFDVVIVNVVLIIMFVNVMDN